MVRWKYTEKKVFKKYIIIDQCFKYNYDPVTSPIHQRQILLNPLKALGDLHEGSYINV